MYTTRRQKVIIMEFKTRLKQLRTMRGISQVDLADRIGVSKSTIGAYETGDRMPGRDALRNLASFFNVSSSYMMCENDDYLFAPEYMPMMQDERFLTMLDNYYQLNSEGQEVVRNTAAGLVASGRYVKDGI